MRYIFLATILGGLLVLGMFGLRGHKFNETPVEIFPDMDRQDRINAQSRSDFFTDGVGSRKPVNGTIPIGFSIPEVAANEGDAILDGFSLAGSYFNSGQMGLCLFSYSSSQPGLTDITNALRIMTGSSVYLHVPRCAMWYHRSRQWNDLLDLHKFHPD